MLKKRAGRNGKPSSRREQPNRQYFFSNSAVRRNRPLRYAASGYALTSSELCFPLRERFAPGKGISCPPPNPTAVCIVISAIRLLLFAAAMAPFVRLDIRVPGRRSFSSLSSAAIAASQSTSLSFQFDQDCFDPQSPSQVRPLTPITPGPIHDKVLCFVPNSEQTGLGRIGSRIYHFAEPWQGGAAGAGHQHWRGALGRHRQC